VAPLSIEVVRWPDTVSVADTARFTVRVVDSLRRRPALGATVVFRSSADTTLAFAAAAGANGEWSATADPRQYGGAVLTAVALGSTGAVAGARVAPVRVMERYVQVVATRYGACARSVRALVYCWGGASTMPATRPTVVRGSATQLPIRLARLEAGGDRVCGESGVAAGVWYCWDPDESAPDPVVASLGGLRPLQMAVAAGTSCLLASSTNVGPVSFQDRVRAHCWGPSAAGGGRGAPSASAPYPTAEVVGPAFECTPGSGARCEGFVEVAVAGGHACGVHLGRGLTRVGTVIQVFEQEAVYCWGANDLGQLGMRDSMRLDFGQQRPYRVPRPGSADRRLGPVRLLDVASCVQDGATALCWGGDAADTIPRRVLEGIDARTLAAARGTPGVCGLTAGGRGVACALAGTVRSPNVEASFPAGRLGLLAGLAGAGPWTAVTLGGGLRNEAGWLMHGCGLHPGDGSVLCWGNNYFGQLGRGSRSTSENNETFLAGVRRVLEPDAQP
jgi:hypothetical protein